MPCLKRPPTSRALAATAARSANSNASASPNPQLVQRILRLLGNEVAFIRHPDFTKSDADRRFPSHMQDWPPHVLAKSADGDEHEIVRFAPTAGGELLSRDLESGLFLRMNYAKYRVNRLRTKLSPEHPDKSLVDLIEGLLTEAVEIRNRLVQANVRLVVSIAKHFVHREMTLDDLVSEGNVVLMRAIETFDAGRGFRFSTYATHAIRRHYYALYRKLQTRHRRLATTRETPLEMVADEAEHRDESHQQAHELLGVLERELPERERAIVIQRFGLEAEDGPQLLHVIGERLGISKERVRQLLARALKRLERAGEKLQLQHS